MRRDPAAAVGATDTKRDSSRRSYGSNRKHNERSPLGVAFFWAPWGLTLGVGAHTGHSYRDFTIGHATDMGCRLSWAISTCHLWHRFLCCRSRDRGVTGTCLGRVDGHEDRRRNHWSPVRAVSAVSGRTDRYTSGARLVDRLDPDRERRRRRSGS